MWRRLELRRVESQLEQPETSVKVDELTSVVQSSLVQFLGPGFPPITKSHRPYFVVFLYSQVVNVDPILSHLGEQRQWLTVLLLTVWVAFDPQDENSRTYDLERLPAQWRKG